MLLAEAWQWCLEHNAHIDCRGDTVVIEQPGQDEIHGVSLEDAVELAQAIEHGWNAYQNGRSLPSEDECIETSAQRWQESQADQDYWQRRAAEGYSDCSPTCNCPNCCGDEPEDLVS